MFTQMSKQAGMPTGVRNDYCFIILSFLFKQLFALYQYNFHSMKGIALQTHA